MGKDSILTVVCMLCKMRYYIPTLEENGETTAEATSFLVLGEVIRLHRLPDLAVSDRGPQFISTLWKELCSLLQIDARLSTARHPETNDQTE